MNKLAALALFAGSVLSVYAQDSESSRLKDSYRVGQAVMVAPDREIGSMPARPVAWSPRHLRFPRRFLAPLRSNPFLVSSAKPCNIGLAQTLAARDLSAYDSRQVCAPRPTLVDRSRIVVMQLRTAHSGPLSHHWLELESSYGKVTIGYGPATLPFIDAGQVSLQDGYGNIERISGIYPVPVIGPPPIGYHYARAPGDGRPLGKPVSLTVGQADALIQKMRSRKFVGPYIPLFHDCRTFTCSTLAKVQGHSSLFCYLLFKGYW